jgi:hypothetical protein
VPEGGGLTPKRLEQLAELGRVSWSDADLSKQAEKEGVYYHAGSKRAFSSPQGFAAHSQAAGPPPEPVDPVEPPERSDDGA